jgi:hypothetical protein
VCEANWVSPVKVRQLSVTGVGGYCEADLILQKLSIYQSSRGAGLPVEMAFREPCSMSLLTFRAEPLREELAAFVNAVETRESSWIVTGATGLQILEATLRAVDAGGAV